MSIVAVIVKIMPESPQVDLKKIVSKAKTNLEKENAKNISFQEENIAFGLKALKIKFAWPEEKDTSIIEKALEKIKGVSSVSIEDYRRVFR